MNTLISQHSRDEAAQISRYAILVEQHHYYTESFLSFIRWEGNEIALQTLRDWITSSFIKCPPENMSMFHLDLDTLVSESTAREMAATNVTLRWPPIKLDGTLILPVFGHSTHTPPLKYLKFLNKHFGSHRIGEYIENNVKSSLVHS